jgi:acetaldehyde dehydrogenase
VGPQGPEEAALVGVAVLGAGSVGSRLVRELRDAPGHMELRLVSDVDAGCDGLGLARELGVETSSSGVEAVLERADVAIVFDATSASAHVEHAGRLRAAGKAAIDLTPSATGALAVPLVNLAERAREDDINLLSCPAQVAIPIVRAVTRLGPALYAETVSTLASASVGPATRRHIDEFTAVTARGLEELGGAEHGKSILILSPAEPPVAMRTTVYVVPEVAVGEQEVVGAVRAAVAEMQRLVPGYRLRGEPVLDEKDTPWGRRPTVAVSLDVVGAGDAGLGRCGNLDVAAAAARLAGEEVALRVLRSRQVVA